ncbi:DUF3857 domain-containing protein [Sphingobacterium rhinopitheci]|uniref:DUF3857 domain-containing protein n=1 Tax=Sphingobacterium rhinopitheci TaxID=2781960 RepID=UPI001F5183EF|nr:DUF3857 domain-containing protein [Sphingobacterium rhinopitheci]MCI0921417.1 DUF3857 domain-containing protein [Sphingobacterium rhinopitheci]
MKLLLTTILLIFGIFSSKAQIDDFPIVKYNDINEGTFSIDSTADAIVLLEKGRTFIQSSDVDRAYMVYHTHKIRIKIINKEGFKHANFTLPLYKYGSTFERIESIKGITHNLENGKINATSLENKNIFSENNSAYIKLSKFTLPNIKEGSIIDVEYTIISPDIFNFRTWNFQSDIPKIRSEYNVLIPAVYKYNVTLKGGLKLTDTKSKIENACLTIYNSRVDCSNITYSMDSIPAFIEEPYMLASKNYLSAVYFELEEAIVAGGSKQSFTKKWSDVDRELLTEKSFGGQIKKQDIFKEKIAPSIFATEDLYSKANMIYSWIQKNIKWNNTYGKYSQYGIEEALKTKNGNVADINLALIAALNAAGLDAYPILVSTRNNGLPNNLHPVISDFNYVIAGLKIDDNIIQLDATDRLLPFAQLPLRAINGKGRIIYNKKSSEWIPLTNQIISIANYIFNGKLSLDGTISGELTINSFGLEAYNKRNDILEYASMEEYTEKLDERLPHIDFEKTEILNLEDTQNVLSIVTDVIIQTNQKLINGNNFYINPIFIDRTTRNPFNLDNRTYDVDLGAKRIETYEINIQMPEGVSLVSAPKNVNLKLPENSAKYIYTSDYTDNVLSVEQFLSLAKSIYTTDEYFGLKEVFSRIIQQLKVDYTFKYESK